jgi:peptide/nickel transport system ATP-binding protein
MNPLLSIRGLEITAQRSRTAVVRLEQLTVAPSEIIGLVGPSGSGKTLTALAIIGLLQKREFRITRGEILFEGSDLLKASDPRLADLRGRRLSMIFQEPYSALNPVVRCGQQIEDTIRFHTSAPQEEREETVRTTLTSLGLLDCDRVMRSFPHELSGGQQQRVILAMAIVLRPALLVADEPTAALDPVARQEFVQLLGQLRSQSGTAIVLISHDAAAVRAVSDRVVFMRDGMIASSTSSESERSHFDEQKAEEPLEKSLPQEARSAPILRLEHVTKSFGPDRDKRPLVALDDVSFDVWHSQAVGIIGRSGSGKSTLARCICGLTKPDSGIVRIARNANYGGGRAHRIAERQALQMVFQDPYSSLDPLVSVGDSVGEGLAIRGVSSEAARQRVVELLELVGLDPQYYHRLPHQLSGGQRQRIAIARSLAVNPSILIADEPTSALDERAADQFIELLKSLRRKLSLTYVIVSHDIGVLRRVCDRVVVLQEGRIVEDGATERVIASPAHEETKRLIEAWRLTG